jgi:hypothetical protein
VLHRAERNVKQGGRSSRELRFVNAVDLEFSFN